jgi:hypothetical protein
MSCRLAVNKTKIKVYCRARHNAVDAASPENREGIRMKKLLIVLAALSLLGTAADARGYRVHYGGGKHTTSHGGHYIGGRGSSHKGGHYTNGLTGNRYGSHKW